MNHIHFFGPYVPNPTHYFFHVKSLQFRCINVCETRVALIFKVWIFFTLPLILLPFYVEMIRVKFELNRTKERGAPQPLKITKPYKKSILFVYFAKY